MIRVCLVDDQTLVRQGIRSLLALAEGIEKAIADYAGDVRSRSFPGPEHVYGMKGRKA